MNSENTKQSRLLRYSIIFSIIFAAAAFIVGFFTSSQVILFDGIFTLIGVVLTYFSILAVEFIKKKDFRNYPFGKDALEPFIVIVQYSIILIVSVTNMVTAIQALFNGGNDMDMQSGILYGIFSAILCLIAFLYLKYLAKKNTTAIIEVEIEQWRMSLLISLSMLIGFSIAWIFTRTAWAPYVVYIDPALAILFTLFFIRTAALSIRDSVKELLYAAPAPELTSLITEKVNHLNDVYDFTDMILRIGKVGQKLVIEIDYIIEANSKIDSITAQDNLRAELDSSLSEIPYKKWLSISFTGSRKWAE